MHEDISKILKQLSLTDKHIQALIRESEFQLDEKLEQKNFKVKALIKEYDQLKSKIDGLEEKYIQDKIGESTYKKWFPVYQKDFRIVENKLAELQKDEGHTRKLYQDIIPYLGDLNYIYHLGDLGGKQTMLKGIFPGCLTKEKEGYGTPFIHPMFSANSPNLKGLVRIKKEGEHAFSADSPVCTRSGI